MTKYFMGEIKEENGGMEYTTPFKFKVEKGEDEDTIINEIAANWRGDGHEPNDDAQYESDGTLIYPNDSEEISKALFNKDIPFIHDLTP